MLVRSLVAVGVALAASAAHADVCSTLQQQYFAAGGSGGGSGDASSLTYSLQVAQQSALANHCSGGFFGLFGPPPSPACPQINQQINQLQAQINQAAYQRGGGGIFGGFFAFANTRSPKDMARDQLMAYGCAVPGSGSGGYKTICVRTCDGYYFPMEYGVSSDRFQADAQACQAAYGNNAGGAQLFVMASDGDVANAIPVSGGQPYGAQSYAFSYRTNYNAACVGQLQAGVAALASGAPNATQGAVTTASLVQGGPAVAPNGDPIPLPRPRPSTTIDPETAANAAGGLSPHVIATVAASETGVNGARVVGASYFNLILQQQATASGGTTDGGTQVH